VCSSDLPNTYQTALPQICSNVYNGNSTFWDSDFRRRGGLGFSAAFHFKSIICTKNANLTWSRSARFAVAVCALPPSNHYNWD
jgi:hypothetical protein